MLMNYYDPQQILSAIPGGTIGSVTSAPLVDADIPGDWEGDFDFSEEGNVPNDDTDPIYFDRTNEIFKGWTDSNRRWEILLPTHQNILGSNGVWLGKNDGALGSEKVNDLTSLLEFLASTSLDTSQTFYYYDNTNLHDGVGNIKKVTSYDSDMVFKISIVNGKLDKEYINRAVTFDGYPFNINNPVVRLAGDNEMVIGSILGYSNKRLQIHVTGDNIKFINATDYSIPIGSKIIGHTYDNKGGYVQQAGTIESNLAKSRGKIIHSGLDGQSGIGIVKSVMKFGAW